MEKEKFTLYFSRYNQFPDFENHEISSSNTKDKIMFNVNDLTLKIDYVYCSIYSRTGGKLAISFQFKFDAFKYFSVATVELSEGEKMKTQIKEMRSKQKISTV